LQASANEVALLIARDNNRDEKHSRVAYAVTRSEATLASLANDYAALCRRIARHPVLDR